VTDNATELLVALEEIDDARDAIRRARRRLCAIERLLCRRRTTFNATRYVHPSGDDVTDTRSQCRQARAKASSAASRARSTSPVEAATTVTSDA
jgi:hypothetical protein